MYKIRCLIANFPNFQASFTSNTCAFSSFAGPLRAPYMDSQDPSLGVGCIVQHHRPLRVTVGGDILCCHLPWGSLRVPYMKRVTGVPLGVFLFLLFLIQQQSYPSLGRVLVGYLRYYPSMLLEYVLHHPDCCFLILICHKDSIMDGKSNNIILLEGQQHVRQDV